jgi:sirohydrochlorin ferrochelatase/(2Fe-2S) ferredoxin
MAVHTGVLLLGHGSRDVQANTGFERLVADYRGRRPELTIAHGYVELATPSLADALQDLAPRCERLAVLPVFLFGSGHIKNDVPLALAAAHGQAPRTQFISARPLGVDVTLAQLAFERIQQAPGAPAAPQRTAVVAVGRGSSDPDANGDFYKLTRLIAEGRGWGSLHPCFAGITGPTVEDALEAAARSRPERIVVLPYLFFAGRIVEVLRAKVESFAAQHPWLATAMAPPLGSPAPVLALLDQRLDEALDGRAPMPCDACQYRVPVGGIAENVGGLRALLWSVRHGFTHTQAMPHAHAHRAPRKHVLVCGNADCAGKGGIALLTALRRQVRRAGQQRHIRITRTACLGRCGEGPNVGVYPDGVWYRGVQEQDAAELVREHLLEDRLVARLVDSIL